MHISSSAGQGKETRGNLMTRGLKGKTTNLEEQHVPKEKGKNTIANNNDQRKLRIPGLRSRVKEKPSEGLDKGGDAGKKRKMWIPPGAA